MITNSSDNVCSAGKVLLRETFRAVMDIERSKLPIAGYLQRKDDPRVTVPLYLVRNSFYFKARKNQKGMQTEFAELKVTSSSDVLQKAIDSDEWTEWFENDDGESNAIILTKSPPQQTLCYHTRFSCSYVYGTEGCPNG